MDQDYGSPNQNILDTDTIKGSFSVYQQILRLSLSILCVTFLLVTFKIYQDKGNFTPTDKNAFQAISGSLGLLLSLSFLVRLIQPWGATLPKCIG